MKKIAMFSMFPALLLALSSVAYADTITVNSTAGSGATDTLYLGYAPGTIDYGTDNFTPTGAAIPYSTATTFDPSGSDATVNLGTPGVWAAPIAGSQWVSMNAGTAPGASPSVTLPEGLYGYSQNFTANSAAGLYDLSLSALADDTMEVFLNGTEIVDPGIIGSDATCSDNVPTCTKDDTISLGGLSLLSGTDANQLIFIDYQTVADAGIDYSAVFTSVPEGGAALMYLLLAGLTCFGGMFFSRKQLGKCEVA